MRRYLTVEEFARELGLPDRRALYPHIAAGRLPVLRLGRRIFIDTARLDTGWRPVADDSERRARAVA